MTARNKQIERFVDVLMNIGQVALVGCFADIFIVEGKRIGWDVVGVLFGCVSTATGIWLTGTQKDGNV